jgi:hypothetical protein
MLETALTAIAEAFRNVSPQLLFSPPNPPNFASEICQYNFHSRNYKIFHKKYALYKKVAKATLANDSKV